MFPYIEKKKKKKWFALFFQTYSCDCFVDIVPLLCREKMKKKVFYFVIPIVLVPVVFNK